MSTLRTLRALLPSQGPAIVMLPPLPALLVVLVSRLGRRKRPLLADLHSGVFLDPKWRRVCGLTLRSLRGHAAIVTNEALAAVCRRAGVKTYVLDDPLVPAAEPAVEATPDKYVLVVLTYAEDEPVAEILGAAAQRPEITFVLTGSAPPAVREAAPANIRFPGFVPLDEYIGLLRGASAVLALTTRQDTMQRAAYEGLEHVVPVVTSDTRVLRDYFRNAVVHTGPRVTDIASAVDEALRGGQDLRRKMRDLQAEKLDRQARALESIADYLYPRRAESLARGLPRA